ncbi:MAG: zinc metallopeptidase [Negativibacillus sp.]|nr:zinc metallopeptidase [Negativibacillus sp.]
MFFYYFDRYYWILIVPAMIFAMWAQMRVSSTFNRYSKVGSARGLSAAQVCRQILDENGLFAVRVERVSGNLTDHYDPRNNVIRLSDSVYHSTSVAAIGVAAHEAGHAVQYSVGYVPIKIRNSIIPVSKLGSTLSMPILLVGLLFNSGVLVEIGILLFSTMALFQLVTLPVEFNASGRALRTLGDYHILDDEETRMAGKVLKAAALTYVAALLSSAAQLLRLILLYGRRRND